MASVPKCSLCKITEKVEKLFEKRKKNFLIYSVFIVLFVELFSNLINYFYIPENKCYDVYAMFFYPLLSQLCMFLVCTSLFLWRERLHFCLRKATTTMFLSIYYAFNFLSILFCFSANVYFQVVNIGLITISLLIFVQSIYAKHYELKNT